MATKSLHSLGAMVRKRRGERRLREVATEIGISAPTLLRIEEGRIPDVATFGKVCKWLGIDPKSLLGIEDAQVPASQSSQPQSLTISAHFKADKTPKAETIQALATLLAFAAREFASDPDTADGDA
jgi:transcriptional regulator with XRE-family HTH domain